MPPPPASEPGSEPTGGWSLRFWGEIKAACEPQARQRGVEPTVMAWCFLAHLGTLHREGEELFADWTEGWTEHQRLEWCWAGAIARTDLDFPPPLPPPPEGEHPRG